MTVTLIRYDPYCQITASFPIKRSSNNSVIPKGVGWGGMPQKFYGADGNSSFAIGRKIYRDSDKSTNYSSANGIYGPELIEALENQICCNNQLQIRNQKNPGNKLIRHFQEVGKPISGNKSIIATSDEYIRRKKNQAIGKGTNPKLTEEFSLKGISAPITASQSLRRARSSGYVVPPKCRANR